MVETKLNNIRMLLLQNSAETLMERVQIATLFDFFSEKELSIGTTNQILDLNGFARLYREDLIYDVRVITSDRVLPQLANLVGGSSGYVSQYKVIRTNTFGHRAK
ncbi:hypothetical protein [Alkalimonas amylolytica]|uniref:hypothetical protein n=1 Tax=Alkalimonas amylolytica TaxID=152573 RepID=UPI001114A48E|nr:hypothetical protein [Alkalimonas amylolytica]